MADDVTLNAASGTFVAATDDIGSGRQAQLVKPIFGGDGSATMVRVDAGLPVQSGWIEVTGSAAANNTDLWSGDVSGYRWISVQITGTFSATVAWQQSNDGTNWVAAWLAPTTNISQAQAFNTTSAGMFAGPIQSRYLRLRTTAYASGTASATIELSATAAAVPPTSIAYVTGSVTATGSGSVTDAMGPTAPVHVAQFPVGFNGATYDRWRNPNRVFTVAATASGDTALWSPGTSNRWRLQRVKFDVTGDATISGGGVLTIALRDATTAINVTQSVYVPGTGGTTLGGWTSGWIDLGNGIQSGANDQDLNVNLSAALTAGTCRVIACGTQGAGTAA